MGRIVVDGLVKTFRVTERKPGIAGALASLFHRKQRVVHALDGLSFEIAPGELVGYIGANGAGKSTTVKILAGVLVPDSGVCTVNGRVPWRDRVAHVARIGVVFGQRTQLWTDLPVIESFELLRDIYAVDRERHRRTQDELVALLGIEAVLDTPVRQLSLGQRMRCDLAAALLHDPDLLFLDEPTIGLDAAAKLAVRDFIRRCNRERGTTVILTTHDLDDIEELCPRVLMIGEGRTLFDGSIEALRSRFGARRRLIVDLVNSVETLEIAEASVVEHTGARVTLEFDPERVATPALIAELTRRYAVRDLFVENPPIERLIAGFYRDPLRSGLESRKAS